MAKQDFIRESAIKGLIVYFRKQRKITGWHGIYEDLENDDPGGTFYSHVARHFGLVEYDASNGDMRYDHDQGESHIAKCFNIEPWEVEDLIAYCGGPNRDLHESQFIDHSPAVVLQRMLELMKSGKYNEKKVHDKVREPFNKELNAFYSKDRNRKGFRRYLTEKAEKKEAKKR